MKINVIHVLDFGQIVNVLVNDECLHADTETDVVPDWFGEDEFVTKCAFCNEVLERE